MYISNNLYSRSCVYVNMDDRNFFIAALEEAKSRLPEISESGFNTDYLKKHVPIAHISSLSNQTKSESAVDRRYVHNLDRAQRKFLMGDVDFEKEEKDIANALYAELKAFAKKHNTYLMIYPTLSCPEKPRFRFIFLVNRPLKDQAYTRAMVWLYGELNKGVSKRLKKRGTDYNSDVLTDESDLRINTNRNLPLFDKEAQLKYIYSNFDDDSLNPLDIANLYKDVKIPKRKRAKFVASDTSDHAKPMNSDLLIRAAERMAREPIAQSYEGGFWRIVQSIAASVVCDGITEETAKCMLDAFAIKATDDVSKQRAWKIGNMDLYHTQKSRILTDEDLEKIKPLCKWREFFDAVEHDDED